MKRKVVSFIIMAGLIATMAGGCGTTGSSESDETSNEKKEEAANEEETTSEGEQIISFWKSSDATDGWYEEKNEEFNEQNAGKYKVEMEVVASSGTFSYDDKVSAAVTSNTLPDIMMVDGSYVSTYAENELIIPIEQYIAAEDKEDLMPGALQQNTYDGQLYAYSITESSVALYYNIDMLEAAGIKMRTPEAPEDALTWQEFEEIACALTKDDVVGTNIILDKGEGMIYALLPFYVSAGTNLISEDGTQATGYFNNEAAYEATEFLNNLIQNGYANVDPIDNEFANQKAATMISGSYQLANAESWDFNWGVTYYPIKETGAEAASPNGDWVFTITSSSDKPEAAAGFISFICSKENCAENAKVNSKIPARSSVMEESEEWEKYPNSIFREELLKTSHARPSTPVYATLTSEFSNGLFDIFSGADIQETLDNAAAAIDKEYETVYGK